MAGYESPNASGSGHWAVMMLGVVIAAGSGRRMEELTAARPKCLLPIAGRPLLAYTIENLRRAGCDEVVVVVGYRAETIRMPGITRVVNPDYRTNNVLHSLMSARARLSGSVMVAYSDIWVEPGIYQELACAPGEIVLAVDRDWRPYYDGRTAHPVSEAENVFYDSEGEVARLGKNLGPFTPDGMECGEFLGLWRMSDAGTLRFCAAFDELDRRLGPDEPFQAARAWKNAYVTDMMQELVDRGQGVSCCLIERGWAELDTPQDYERLSEVAERQRLWTLVKAQAQRT